MCWTVGQCKTISFEKQSWIQLIWFPLAVVNVARYWRWWETRWGVINSTLYRQSLFVPIMVFLVLQLYFQREPLCINEGKTPQPGKVGLSFANQKEAACRVCCELPGELCWLLDSSSDCNWGHLTLAEPIYCARLNAVMNQESKQPNGHTVECGVLGTLSF